MKINVLDFAEYPGPRYKRQGDFSGEEYYITVLNPAFAKCYQQHEKLEINLDGTAGYPSSFLDEAFGELIYDFSEAAVEAFVVLKTERFKRHLDMIYKETFPQWEKKRINKIVVSRSMTNCDIFVLENNEIKQMGI